MPTEERPPPDEHTGVALMAALARMWTKIRSFHPGVPGVVLLAAPSPHGHFDVLGHFSALRWRVRRDGGRLHEVVVVAEHLNRSPEDVLETLLHEAAHAINFEQGVHDCSASQYHNTHFREAAEGLGLGVQRVPHYGYALTTLPRDTALPYAAEIASLDAVLVHRARRQILLPLTPPAGGDASGDDGSGAGGANRMRKAVCGCGHIIRVSRKTIASTTIRCDTCNEPFRLT